VKFSVALPTSYEGLGYPIGLVRDGTAFVRLARTAEALGYDGLWGNDHVVTPDLLRGSADDVRPEGPPSFFDPLAVLGHVAAVTERIRLGTAVLDLPLRDPVTLAKQVATVDVLSRGRLTLGVGLGAYPEELVSVRPDVAGIGRGRIFDEAIAALRMLLDLGHGSFEGRAVRFGDVELAPAPAQRPFPIYIGGHTTKAIERAALWGQGWMPGWRPIAELREWVALLRERAAASGRDPRSIEVAPELSALVARRHEEAVQRYESSRFVRHRCSRILGSSDRPGGIRRGDPTGRDPALMTASNLVGSPEAIRERVGKMAEAGVDHCAAIAFPAESVDEMVEQWQLFAEEVIPRTRVKSRV
jgi:probable F420-dependent oxidoreductase